MHKAYLEPYITRPQLLRKRILHYRYKPCSTKIVQLILQTDSNVNWFSILRHCRSRSRELNCQQTEQRSTWIVVIGDADGLDAHPCTEVDRPPGVRPVG